MSTRFYESSYSGANNSCVEVAHRSDAVLIQDSKYTGNRSSQPRIRVARSEWPSVLDLAVSRRSGRVGDLTVDVASDGSSILTGPSEAGDKVTLHYTPTEWDAFAKGVVDGEFDRS
ncbi:DUF397 domain-containing protein [Nocardia farcinica]|uniref:DUF397 domain-containing protein n=1 Tax=Nocardia farcinica TaxID=37329 RepID=UPI0009712CB4|nr:DUF397 domain-containing protein [Nocardia farcinica]AXK86901.1 DUF397 domain-containing protein [Nocardia farcinica]